MSLERQLRAMRAIGGFSGGSRLARPWSETGVADVRPPQDYTPGLNVTLVRVSLGVASEFNAFSGYEVHLTEDGGFAAGFSVGGTTSTKFVPVLGEGRFSQFTVGPAFTGMHDYVPDPLRWPYVFGDQSGFDRTVRRLDLTSATQSTAVATIVSGSFTLASATRPDVPYGYIHRFGGELRRWSVASEPSAVSSVLVANVGRDFESVRLDSDGNVWLGGDFNGYMQKRDPDGNLVFEVQIPGGPGSSDAYTNFVLPDSIDGALVLNRWDDSGTTRMQWHHVDGAGTVTDITGQVTVDGVAWNTAVTSTFGGPGVLIGSFGDRISMDPESAAGTGVDLLYGTVST